MFKKLTVNQAVMKSRHLCISEYIMHSHLRTSSRLAKSAGTIYPKIPPNGHFNEFQSQQLLGEPCAFQWIVTACTELYRCEGAEDTYNNLNFQNKYVIGFDKTRLRRTELC